MKTTQILAIADTFKFLSDPTRLRILDTLITHGEMCVKELAEVTDTSHSATSHQLAKLEARGIVSSKRDGQTICYTVEDNVTTQQIKQILSDVIS